MFGPGDHVTVADHTPEGHHRTPGYIKGKGGRIEAFCGVFRNPESLAYGGAGLPEVALYRVEFDQAEVWDSYRGPAGDKVYLDIYEHWLRPSRGRQT